MPKFLQKLDYFSKLRVFNWLSTKELLASRRYSMKCSSNMVLEKKASILNKKVWRCTNRVSISKFIRCLVSCACTLRCVLKLCQAAKKIKV